MSFRDETGGPEKSFILMASDITDALSNLVYLIREDAENPGKVRQYAAMAEELLRAMAELLRCEVETGADLLRCEVKTG